MDRSLWTQTLIARRSPRWPCPTCRKGNFELVEKSLTNRETVTSKRSQQDDGWNPEWITYSFTAWVKCNNRSCGEEAAVAGVGGVDPCYGPEGETDYIETFSPRFCTPMPDIFSCRRSIRKSSVRTPGCFARFWSDPSAAANCVRVALERLLDS